MLSLLRRAFGWVSGRANHIPEADLAAVAAEAEALARVLAREAGGITPTAAQWVRAVEAAQVEYLAGRIARQVTPRSLR